MLLGMLRVSCRPIDCCERSTVRELQPWETDQWTSARCSRACRLAELEQLHLESNSYIWSQTVDICLYRNSAIISRSQRLGYKRARPSGLAELEQLHVESNSECNQHVYLDSTLANSHLAIILVSTWPGCACGRSVRVRQLCGYVFLVIRMTVQFATGIPAHKHSLPACHNFRT